MSEENIENITKLANNFAPTFVDHHLLPDITVNKTPWLRNLNTDFILNNCLFGSVKLTKNADPDKYRYSGYDIRFDSPSVFSFTDGSMERNFIIFGADMSSSVHIDNRGKDTLILGEEPTQGLDYTTLTAEAKYPINFIQEIKRFVLRLHYNGSSSFLFLNATKMYQFKAKNSEIKDYTLCLDNILKDLKLII